MSSFVEEFTKYQKQERWLAGVIVFLFVMAPVSFTVVLNAKLPFWNAVALSLSLLLGALVVYLARAHVADKIINTYESLHVGAVLAKKIVTPQPRRFIVTHRDSNRFYLQCLHTGEKVLMSKRRVREDFDITI